MDSLRVPLPPPLLFFIALLAGAALDHFVPWAFLSEAFTLRWGLGGLCCLGALALGAWALGTLRRHRASPEFGLKVTVLVQEGPYRFTRNPLYVALVLVLLGMALALGGFWVALGVPLLILGLDRLVIAREEPFLQDRFGAEYEGYRSRTRRWL